MPKEYLDGLKLPDKPLPLALTVYHHTFEITKENYASGGADNGFANAIRFAVAILSELDVVEVEESEAAFDRDATHLLNTNRFSGLTTYTYQSAEDVE